MSAGTLDPDGDLDDLPVHECAVEATTTTVPGSTTTTSSTTTSTSTTTTVPGETTTTAAQPPPPTTTPATDDAGTTRPRPSTTAQVGQPGRELRSLIATRTASHGDRLTRRADDHAHHGVGDRRPAGLVVTMSYRTLAAATS